MIAWNNSALSCLERCGEQFRRRYIERERRPSGPRQLRGTVVHRVASSALLRKMVSQETMGAEEARDAAADHFEAEWRSGVLVSEAELEEAGSFDAVRGLAKDFAIDVAGLHVESVLPAVNPVAVERKITVRPKDSDLEIHGTIDLIDSTPAGEIIRDLKTSEKSPPRGAAHTSQQLSMYSMIRLAETGKLPASLRLDYLVRTPKRAELKRVELETSRDYEDMRTMVRRLNTAVTAVAKGVFVPAAPDAWYCSRSFCEFFQDCPYVRRGDTRPKE